jgi:hypothetical protein
VNGRESKTVIDRNQVSKVSLPHSDLLLFAGRHMRQRPEFKDVTAGFTPERRIFDYIPRLKVVKSLTRRKPTLRVFIPSHTNWGNDRTPVKSFGPSYYRITIDKALGHASQTGTNWHDRVDILKALSKGVDQYDLAGSAGHLPVLDPERVEILKAIRIKDANEGNIHVSDQASSLLTKAKRLGFNVTDEEERRPRLRDIVSSASRRRAVARLARQER